MSVEHLPQPDREKLARAAQGEERLRSACENFQPGDTLTTPVAQLSPAPPSCPACFRIAHPSGDLRVS